MALKIESALLEACVLSVVKKGDTYGYVLTQSIKKVLDISESTLYPVLRRLQKDEYLRTYDEPYAGRNRRYYAITEKGMQRCEEYVKEWNDYKQKIDELLSGGVDDE